MEVWQPISHLFPNSFGEAALEDKMCRGLRSRGSKGAHPTIGPTTALKAIICPKLVLEHKPCIQLAFWWRPSLPHRGLEICQSGAVAKE